MTPEKQRIAIAEACGYKKYEHVWQEPVGDPKAYVNPALTPDYLSDLNAMHEAEKVFPDRERQSDYAGVVIEVLNRDHSGEPRFLGASQFNQIHATAAQRAEAFLRTLNLWK